MIKSGCLNRLNTLFCYDGLNKMVKLVKNPEIVQLSPQFSDVVGEAQRGKESYARDTARCLLNSVVISPLKAGPVCLLLYCKK